MALCNRGVRRTLLGACAYGALGLTALATRSTCGQEDQGDAAPQQQFDNQQSRDNAIKLQGTGQQSSEKFVLQPGLTMVEVSHDGQSNLIIRLLDEDGQNIDTLFNQIGAFRGEQGFGFATGGQRLLEIAADGNWTVAINQPQPTDAQRLPTELQGTGYEATPFIQLDKGLVVFKMKHNGESRFRVTLRDRDGQLVETLVNTLGAFEGSKPVSIETPGVYFLNVGADGDWSIDAQ
ncbi:MAG TPA: hypothetical protein VGG64_04095 [Pirellulales bacterium]|jgi:hypothetical protein